MGSGAAVILPLTRSSPLVYVIKFSARHHFPLNRCLMIYENGLIPEDNDRHFTTSRIYSIIHRNVHDLAKNQSAPNPY